MNGDGNKDGGRDDARDGGGKAEQMRERSTGGLQIIRTTGKSFGPKLQGIFFEHLAATCNVTQSAAAAGVTTRCVYKKRMRDEAFRRTWALALEQGYARLEMRAVAHAGAKVEIQGDKIVEEGPFDPSLATCLLREHGRSLAGAPRRARRAAPPAPWHEVEEYFVARLKILRKKFPRPEGAAE